MTAAIGAMLHATVTVGIVGLRIAARILRMTADVAAEAADLAERARNPTTA
jgi:hypothetical protein